MTSRYLYENSDCRVNRPLVVFDLDDTLYPERDFVAGGFKAIAKLLGSKKGQNFARHAWRLFDQEGMRGVRNIIVAASADCGIADEHVDALENTYRAHAPVIQPRPGMLALLESLKACSWVGLLSDGRYAEQRRKWTALGLEHLFDHVIFTDEFGRDAWKPSSICFLKLQNECRTPQALCIYVADNPEKDFVAPRNLGWKSIRLVMDDQIHRDNFGPAADHTVKSVNDLTHFLHRILRP